MTIKYAVRFDDAGFINMKEFINDMMMYKIVSVAISPIPSQSQALLLEFSDEDLMLEYLAERRAQLEEYCPVYVKME